MPEPAEAATAMEAAPELPAGSAERFAGYGVMGMPFTSGHVLAMRRFPASSIGAGYTSVWHRDPDERWTFYQDQPASMGCARYFGPEARRVIETSISVEWEGPRSLTVTTRGERPVGWHMTLAPTRRTRALNTMGRVMPRRWWQLGIVLKPMGLLASTVLRTGKMRMSGQTPNGQWFISNPAAIWMIPDGQATVDGIDLGPTGPTPDQARLEDVWIPNRGLFAIGTAFFEPFDAGKHSAAD